MIKSISCFGFRSFATMQTLELAVPTGERGSGLTVLIGPNGGGKSTLVECFQKISIKNGNVSFTSGKRNHQAGDSVSITVRFDDTAATLATVDGGGSEAVWSDRNRPRVYFLPARRVFNPYFGRNIWNRDTFIDNPEITQFRASVSDNFSHRLFDISKNNRGFNSLFWRILGKELHWTIDQEDSGSYYVKVMKDGGVIHNSDGLGEGIISLMFIVDAIYNSNPNEIIVIDEPELSLHPQLQLRLLDALMDITTTTQVVISTHSPTMVSMDSIVNGGVIARIHEEKNASVIDSIDDRCRSLFKSTLRNINNPHIFGNDARSCFFTEDGLIITEGQEDVVIYPQVARQIGIESHIPFFGFGAGGASRITDIAYILHCLGFKKVGAIYDGDKRDDYELFCRDYGRYGYKAWIIPADDVRDKPERAAMQGKLGLVDEKGSIKKEYSEDMTKLFRDINAFLHR